MASSFSVRNAPITRVPVFGALLQAPVDGLRAKRRSITMHFDRPRDGELSREELTPSDKRSPFHRRVLARTLTCTILRSV
jgi:hypothetical protein